MQNKLEYTNADYQSIKDNVVKNILELGGDWTDFNESDVGMVLLNAFAGIGDMLLYYLDNRTRESYITTAQLRQSIIDITEVYDYRLKRKTSPEVKVQIRRKVGAEEKVLRIPRFTKAITSSNSTFTILEYGEIGIGEELVELLAIKGELRSKTFRGTNQRYQEYRIDDTEVMENFFEVTVNGEIWEEDKSEPSLTSTMNTYKLRANEDEEVVIVFSHILGNIPETGDVIQVSYVKDEEEISQIREGTIIALDGTLRDVEFMKITNEQVSTEGKEKETVEEARINAPKSLRSLWRAVNGEDYEIMAERFPGIGKAKAIKNLELEDPWKTVEVCVAAQENRIAISEELKENLKTYLEMRNGLCTNVVITDALYTPIHIEVTVEPTGQYGEEIVEGSVRKVIEEYFKGRNQTFGGNLSESNSLGIDLNTMGGGIKLSDMFRIIDTLPGVRYLDYTKLAREEEIGVGNIGFGEREIAYLETLVINVGDR